MKCFEDFQVGEKKITRGRTITEADFTLFAAITGDWHPLHTNAEYARKTQFGERIFHGLGVLSLTSGLISPELTGDGAFIAFLGIDKARFAKPVKIGDTLNIIWEIIDKKEHDDKTGIISARQSIRNQNDEEVAYYLTKFLVHRRK